ncbi:gliding motility protein GldM [Carboxylicivirga sp. M1479]|uniref:type IX secretion system motor protein PorM/GldM n=1 Tax=Carboxylicivirga sp. M1479 TaxID=2594476 RepID=UPI0011774A36|nr:gliding motility protein GldM [Carboxylicivirga sp. M1479]TRX61578.1 gliding motility protein GldM [Carboxylicivirga sp. M1479]
MSGGNCPETGRQKMIGMMYLFLTAMLALNVSGELLQAFQLVDKSIQESIKATDSKNLDIHNQFRAAEAVNAEKVKPVREKVESIYEKADTLYNQIQELKLMMMRTADNSPEATLDNYKGSDNQDIAPQIMMVEKGGERSKNLIADINEYRDYLISIISEEDTALISALNTSLSTEAAPPSRPGQVQVSWASQKFEHLPLSASFALLTSIQSNVRNAQADVATYLLAGIDENTYKFNDIRSVVIPSSAMVLKGETYSAKLLIAATDKYQKPRFDIEGYSVKPNEDGEGILEIRTNKTGRQEWSGKIWFKDPNGIEKPYEVTHTFDVVQPNAVISPLKMNVFYEALENPVEVSVPGVPANQLEVSFSNATKRSQGDGVYIVIPKPGFAGGKSIVTVYANISGERQRIGSKEFRIKPLPLPYATFAGKRDGKVKKNLLKVQNGIFATMGPDFDFELEYKVTQFSIAATKGGFFQSEPSKSNRLTDAQIELINSLGRGAKLMVEEIKAIGPDKRNKKLAPIVLTID